MKTLLMGALLTGATLVAMAPADAAQGCGRGFHRGPHGECFPNGGPRPVFVGPGGPLVVDRYYEGRGYWDGRRYWHRRRPWHGGWRYY